MVEPGLWRDQRREAGHLSRAATAGSTASPPRRANSSGSSTATPRTRSTAGGTGTRNDFIGTPVVHDNKVFIGVGQDPEHTTGIAAFYCIAPTKKGDISKFLAEKAKDADGKEKIGEKQNPNSCEVWRYDGVEDARRSATSSSAARCRPPCVVDDVVYISELHGYLHCLDAKTGQHFWQFDTKASIWGSPYYVDGKILLCNDNELFIFKHEKKHEVIDEVEAAKDAKTMKEAAIMKKVRDGNRKEVRALPGGVRRHHSLDAGRRQRRPFVQTYKSLYAIKCVQSRAEEEVRSPTDHLRGIPSQPP